MSKQWLVVMAIGTVLAATASRAQDGGSITVVPLPGTPSYDANPNTDVVDYTVTLATPIKQTQQLWVRIFLGSKADLSSRAASVPKGQCRLFSQFERFAVTSDTEVSALQVEQLILYARRISADNATFLLVFERGDDGNKTRDSVKIDRDAIASYFGSGLEVKVKAGDALRIQHQQMSRPTWVEETIARLPFHSDHPPVVQAASTPVVNTVDYAPQPCHVKAPGPAPRMPAKRTASADRGPLPATILEEHRCGL